MIDGRERITNEVSQNGFAFCAQLSPSLSTGELATVLGNTASLHSGPPVHTLTPKNLSEAAPNTYSGNYGLGEFPLHTDMANWHSPPRYLLLRCIVGSAHVATTILNPWPAVKKIGVENLTRALMKPRRRISGRMGLLPIIQIYGNDSMIRWDSRYLIPASRMGELYANELRAIFEAETRINIELLNPGDTIVIDNWRMLHGRTAVPEESRSRCIERVYLRTLAQ